MCDSEYGKLPDVSIICTAYLRLRGTITPGATVSPGRHKTCQQKHQQLHPLPAALCSSLLQH